MATQYFWTKQLADEVIEVGLTQAGQQALGIVSFLELPKVKTQVIKDQPFMNVEAEKVVSEFNSPVTGEVLATNPDLLAEPAQVTTLAAAATWLIRVRPAKA